MSSQVRSRSLLTASLFADDRLNVFSPMQRPNSTLLPVMVWIHGGEHFFPINAIPANASVLLLSD